MKLSTSDFSGFASWLSNPFDLTGLMLVGVLFAITLGVHQMYTLRSLRV